MGEDLPKGPTIQAARKICQPPFLARDSFALASPFLLSVFHSVELLFYFF
jgi:hypothetical protein